MVWLRELSLMVLLPPNTPGHSPGVHITTWLVTTEPLGTLQEREMEEVDGLIVVILGRPGTRRRNICGINIEHAVSITFHTHT